MNTVLDERKIFLRGNQVHLVALTREDVLQSNWYGWFNCEETCSNLQKHYFPNTPDAQMEFWERVVVSSKSHVQLGIFQRSSEKLVGVTSISNIDFLNRKGEFSIVIGEPEGRNISTFLETAGLIFRHAFQTLNLNRIYGGSISRELVVLMCRSLKCQEEGVLRGDVFKNGQYHDVHRYGLLRADWEKQ